MGVTGSWTNGALCFGPGASNGIRIRPPKVFFFPALPYSDSHDMPLDFVCLHFVCLHFDSLLTLC